MWSDSLPMWQLGVCRFVSKLSPWTRILGVLTGVLVAGGCATRSRYPFFSICFSYSSSSSWGISAPTTLSMVQSHDSCPLKNASMLLMTFLVIRLNITYKI